MFPYLRTKFDDDATKTLIKDWKGLCVRKQYTSTSKLYDPIPTNIWEELKNNYEQNWGKKGIVQPKSIEERHPLYDEPDLSEFRPPEMSLYSKLTT